MCAAVVFPTPFGPAARIGCRAAGLRQDAAGDDHGGIRRRREYLPAIEAGRVALFGDHKPAGTLVGAAALSRSDYLIEVDAIAVTGG